MYTYKSNCNGIFFDAAIPKTKNSKLIIILPGLPEYPLPKELMFKLADRGYYIIYPRYHGTFESGGDFLSKSPAYDILDLIKYLKKRKDFLELYNKKKFIIDFKEIIVLASSFGGSVALHLAKLTKDVNRYIIIAPVLDFENHGKKYKEQDLKNLGKFLKEGFPFLYRFKEIDYEKLLKGKIIPSAFQELNKLSENIILVHGSADEIVSIENTKSFIKKFPKAKLIKLDGEGHLSISKLNFNLLIKILEENLDIDAALVMCGGNSIRFGTDKSLFKYKRRTMISYVLDALKETNVKNIILQANEINKDKIKREAEQYLKNFLVLSNPLKRYREFTKTLSKYLKSPFFLLGGNQPMKKDFLKKLDSLYKQKRSWVVTLYPKEISEITEQTMTVSLLPNSQVVLDSKGKFIIHPPFIITGEIKKYQEKENFNFKVDRTICNLLNIKKVYGIIADMPPEFDDAKMLKNTIKFIDEKIKNEA